MLVADTYLGSVEEAALAERVEREEHATVTLDDTERRRSRVRTSTDDGTDLGIVIGRELGDGDVLDADGSLIVVALDTVPAMVLDFAAAGGDTATVTAAVALGHAVGNRHWSLAVKGNEAYLSIADDRNRMEAAVRPLLPGGTTIGYREVSPTLFDEAGTHDHTHDSDDHGRTGNGHAHGGDGHTHGGDGQHHSHVTGGTTHSADNTTDSRNIESDDE
ncbi:urease accessory protein UreE [Halococcus sp. PRR34]|uniref:urease accessory protein UreE n=1 Tax=Halococcus sp. PRR34 TaxID=3020830 RepID=UPI00235DD2EE|nr:urease accessory protein UreE [Halococcus sp. PRR34]